MANKWKSFHCLDCKKNTAKIDEYYMVRNSVWLTVVPNRKGMLCVNCLEKRLDRRLSHDDFIWAPVNMIACVTGSKRLRNRLNATAMIESLVRFM